MSKTDYIWKLEKIRTKSCIIHRTTLVNNSCYKCNNNKYVLRDFIYKCRICKYFVKPYCNEYCINCFMCNKCNKISRFPGLCKWCKDCVFNKKSFLEGFKKYPKIFFCYLIKQDIDLYDFIDKNNTFDKNLIKVVLEYI